MAKNSSIIWGVVVGALIVAVIFGGIMYSSDLSTTSSGTNILKSEGASCDIDPTVTFQLADQLSAGKVTSSTDPVAYRVKGSTIWNEVAGSSSVSTLQFGDVIEAVVYDADAETGKVYSEHKTEIEVGCGDNTVELKSYEDAAAGDLTATFTNDLGQISTAATMTADGSVYTVMAKEKVSADEAFGNPFVKKSVVNIRVNSTEITDVNVIGGTATAIPNKALAGLTGYSDFAFEVPVVLTDSDSYEFEIELTTADDITGNVVTDGTFYIYPMSYYVNQDTGVVGFGAWDEKGNLLGTADTLTLDYTA